MLTVSGPCLRVVTTCIVQVVGLCWPAFKFSMEYVGKGWVTCVEDVDLRIQDQFLVTDESTDRSKSCHFGIRIRRLVRGFPQDVSDNVIWYDFALLLVNTALVSLSITHLVMHRSCNSGSAHHKVSKLLLDLQECTRSQKLQFRVEKQFSRNIQERAPAQPAAAATARHPVTQPNFSTLFGETDDDNSTLAQDPVATEVSMDGQLPTDRITAKKVQELCTEILKSCPPAAEAFLADANSVRARAENLELDSFQERASPLAMLGAAGVGKSTLANQVSAHCRIYASAQAG